jgi:hypothetical protein
MPGLALNHSPLDLWLPVVKITSVSHWRPAQLFVYVFSLDFLLFTPKSPMNRTVPSIQEIPQKELFRAGRMTQVVEHLPSNLQALTSNTSTTKKKKKKKKKELLN